MPELPEVETIVSQLQRRILMRTITSVNIDNTRIVPKSIMDILPATITSVTRRAKSIVMSLDNGVHVVFHLRMTGHFSFDKSKYKLASFKLDNGTSLNFHSIRKFSTVKVVEDLEKEFSHIGPEPLEMKAKGFVELLRRFPRANVKSKLLDQTCIAGIGNIYAQEALYHAGIHPQQEISTVNDDKLHVLGKQMQRVLKLSIKNNGTTIQDYNHIDGKGDFQNLLAVYGKEKCPKKHLLEKIKISGRGTWFCGKCQKI
jgi:formamidopyrimidine-DNA glycosylase